MSYRRVHVAAWLAMTITISVQAAGSQSATDESVPVSGPGKGIPLAVTLDDLPFVGATRSGDTRAAANGRIIGAAAERGVPLAGFITCRNEEAEPGRLRAWIDAGITLGNHSWNHRSLDALGLEAWRADITRCQDFIDKAADRPVRFFRYPFLQTGKDRALRDAGFAILAELGLRRAPVSIDTSEWALVRPYVNARDAGDTALAREIGDAYVAHLRFAARRAVRVAAEIGHPRAAQVLLLHANALAADRLGEVLDALGSDGFRFVPLAEALADPVYGLEDHWVGGIGLSWLYRVDPEVEASRWWAWEAGQQHAFDVRFSGAAENDAFDLDRDLAIRRVADHAWVVTDSLPWSANSLLAEMPDGSLLLVDTPNTGIATRSLLDWLEMRFGPRRLVVVNTHFHPDALAGNRVLAAAGAEIYGSTETVRLLAEHREAIGAVLADQLGQRPAFAAEYRPWEPLPPQRVFEASDGLRLELGGEPVMVRFPGAAHSPDNLVVWLPERTLLYGGCMVRAGLSLGNLGDADVRSWPAAIGVLQKLGAGIVIPGHGGRTDPGLLDHTLELLGEAGVGRSDSPPTTGDSSASAWSTLSGLGYSHGQ